ncbi:2-succinyl-6-hydroxy-2,4-cyclohexadiene-1-carboxylate synthase [Bacillus xiapuensis]|uniref:2-succinyl-6-hydroxy-2, 4-cyclohexadiene-1-carboxylate synthase n=1 Tax=Bacillus xiapuensis TaxID=2014075 RepID=UPI000C23146C|nr:2-succinyl-6-hydroxy-2,4-cyclohexadiene-1-carboxylate synthase [Bacillus xiapuensis]
MEIKIHNSRYYCRVDGSGDPILLLHGFTGDHTTWTETVKQLQSDFCCVTVDILGHGKSSCPADSARYNIEQVALDLKELMSQLGYPRFHLLGYSMGGRLALTMAVRFPEAVKSLMLESSSPGLKTEEERAARREADIRLADAIEKEGIEAFVNHWESIPLFASQKKLPLEYQQAVRRQRLQNRTAGLAGSLKGMGTGAQPSWWEEMSTLKMPVLLVTGTLDQKFTNIAREMFERLPFPVWKQAVGKGHAIHVEDNEEFGTIIREFLFYT